VSSKRLTCQSIAGTLYNVVKEHLVLTQAGSNASQFAKESLAPLITEKTVIYKELEKEIFLRVSNEVHNNLIS